MYTFHVDPGHGWLEVPRRECVELGIAENISRYSYENDDTVYLEEDCDASLFIEAWERVNGRPFTKADFRERYADPCFVRELPHYRARKEETTQILPA